MITDYGLHYCTFPYPDAWQGFQQPVVETCLEDENGYLWLYNLSIDCSDIIVNYCPFCGYKAAKQMESK